MISVCTVTVLCCVYIFFFFSSRRRHTRCSRDWSSDVCSSDLSTPALGRRRPRRAGGSRAGVERRRGAPRGWTHGCTGARGGGARRAREPGGGRSPAGRPLPHRRASRAPGGRPRRRRGGGGGGAAPVGP